MTANRRLAPVSVPRGRWPTILAIAFATAVFLSAAFVLRYGSGTDGAVLRQDATKAAQQSQWAEAEAILARLPEPTPSDWLLRAVVATSLNRPEAAADYLAKIPPGGPLAARVALVAGRVELGRSRARPMEEALRRALQLDPKLAEARRSLVFLYGMQGRRAELLGQFAALAEQGPLTFSLVEHWCIAHQEQIEEPADLKPTLEKFVAADTDDRWSRLGLARAYRRLGLFDRSREVLAPLPDSDPEARAGRAEIEFDRGDFDALAVLLADGPEDHPRLARLRGQLALNRNDGPAALRYFRLSDGAEPNHAETLYGLAQALRLVGQRAEAEPYSRRASAQRAFRDHLTTLAKNSQESRAVLCCRLAAECEASAYLPEARAWYRLALVGDPLNREAQEGLFRLSSQNPAANTGPPSSK